jgi:RNA polymerase sigma-70 factor, ECF subfamily
MTALLQCEKAGIDDSMREAGGRVLDHEEFVRQMAACHSALEAFVLTLVPRCDCVDEIVQNTNVEMWLNRETFAEGTNFVAWACRIAHFKVLEYRSALARDRLIFDDELVEAIAVDAEQYVVDASERSRALNACLEKLLPSQRDLIQKRYEEGASLRELAKQMQRTPGSLGVTLFRIRKALLDCIQRKLAGRKS